MIHNMRKLAILSILLCLTVPAYAGDMDRVYIQIPVADKGGSRTEYYKLTGMKIPDKMSMNAAETHYLTGELKSHFSNSQKTSLDGKVSSLIFTDGWPVDWVRKADVE